MKLRSNTGAVIDASEENAAFLLERGFSRCEEPAKPEQTKPAAKRTRKAAAKPAE